MLVDNSREAVEARTKRVVVEMSHFNALVRQSHWKECDDITSDIVYSTRYGEYVEISALDKVLESLDYVIAFLGRDGGKS